METNVLISACILIGIGVLMKRFPMLIAGYNTLTEEEKKKVDTKGLSNFMCYSFVGMGIAPIAMYYICLGIGHADWAGMSSLLPIVYLPYLIYKANTYDHNPPKKSRRYIVSLALLIITIVAVLMLYGMSATKVRIEDGKLSFTGMFGVDKPLNNFSTVRLSDSLPNVTLRLSGISVGGINKGLFKLESGTSCNMYLSSSKPPYIVFVENSGREIFYNSKDSTHTLEVYNNLSPLFNK